LNWEISMTYPNTERRSLAQIRPARRTALHRGRDLRPGHGGMLVLSSVRHAEPTQATPAAWSPLAIKATTLCYCAGNALPNLLLAMLSWAIAEVVAGCAAYAEALYAVPVTANTDAQANLQVRPRSSLSLVSTQSNGGPPRVRPAQAVADIRVATLPAKWRGDKRPTPTAWRASRRRPS
jgi:hypothetical protein